MCSHSEEKMRPRGRVFKQTAALPSVCRWKHKKTFLICIWLQLPDRLNDGGRFSSSVRPTDGCEAAWRRFFVFFSWDALSSWKKWLNHQRRANLWLEERDVSLVCVNAESTFPVPARLFFFYQTSEHFVLASQTSKHSALSDLCCHFNQLINLSIYL